MHDLRVIGVENGALLAASEDGTRYRLPIDELLQSKLRQAIPEPSSGRKVAPRDIQSQIRAGMSAEEVAAATGASLEFVQKFEGPVLAERNFVISAALAVAVHTAHDAESGAAADFGSVIRERLVDLGADRERWVSWKEAASGWIVKLEFTAGDIDHDARWQFDPKKSTLVPLNSDATTLSQQGEITGSLIPRLRAVGGDERVPDTSRFDSGAFTDGDLDARDTAPYLDVIPFTRNSQQSVSEAAINRAPADTEAEAGHTADLLEALRRRRGERETAAAFDELTDAKSSHPSTGSIRVIDVPLDDFNDDEPEEQPEPPRPLAPSGKQARKGRTAMPSWDDIVFGAKSDED